HYEKNCCTLIFPRIQIPAEKSVKLVILGGGGRRYICTVQEGQKVPTTPWGSILINFTEGEQRVGGGRGREV
ncbi:MAG: hypothetical protein ACK55Z_13425, partial [bacterium]